MIEVRGSTGGIRRIQMTAKSKIAAARATAHNLTFNSDRFSHQTIVSPYLLSQFI